MSLSATAVMANPAQSRLLSIAAEVRQKSFKHVFAKSKVVVGRRYKPAFGAVVQDLEVEVLLVCRQLHDEAQVLLESLTKLVIASPYYTLCNVPTPILVHYIPRIEHVSVHVFLPHEILDVRPLTSLKMLTLRLSGGIYPQQAPLAVDLRGWLDLIEGRKDQVVFDHWRDFCQTLRDEKRRYGLNEEVFSSKWLIKMIDKPATARFKICVQFSMRRQCVFTDDSNEDNPKTRTAIFEVYFDSTTEQVHWRKHLEDSHLEEALNVGVQEDQVLYYLLDHNESGAFVNSVEAGNVIKEMAAPHR